MSLFSDDVQTAFLQEDPTRSGGPPPRRSSTPRRFANGSHRHQRIHLGLCDEWGGQRTYPTITWARPLSAQLSALELSNATIERVVHYLSQPAPRGDELRRKRLERQRRELALDHAAGRNR